MINLPKRFAAVAVLVAAVAAGGCSGSPRPEYPSVVSTLPGGDPDAQVTFWHTLGEQRITTNDDAFHGLLLFADGEDPATTYEERVAALQERGWLPRGFDRPAGEAVRRGTLAVPIAQIAELRGGLFRSIFPRSERYALRELVFQGLYPPSSENQTFTGTEFLGIIGRLEDHQRRSGATAAADEPANKPVQGIAPSA